MKNILKNISFAIIVILASYGITNAGNLFPAGTTISSTFYTLGDIYNKLTDNTSSADEGDHDLNSSGTPTSTFYTLKQIYQAIPTIDADKMLTTADYMGVQGTIQIREISSTTAVINAGYYSATNLTTIDTDLVAGNILSGVSIFGVSGSIANIGVQNITPSTTAQTITAGYHNGSGTVSGDADLVAGNIKSGVTIFGETGTMSPSQPLKTGQTKCYDPSGSTEDEIPCSGTGQDGEYQIGQAMSYTTTTNIVLDNSTGLMWKKCSEGLSGDNCETGTATTHTFAQAISICEADTTDGYTDWRLPNIKELLSIVDYGKVSPAINTTIFPETVSDGYWSSTTYLAYPGLAWLVDFSVGGTNFDSKGGGYYVRCTR